MQYVSMALQKRDYVAKTGQSVQMFVLSMRATYCVASEPVHNVNGLALIMLRCVHSQVVHRLTAV